MLSIRDDVELKKQLAGWLCCVAGSPSIDSYLCIHCVNGLFVTPAGVNDAVDHEEIAPDGNSDLTNLQKDFLRLMPDQKMVIYLKVVKGFSNRDVAGTISRSIGAVKAIQDHAMKILFHLSFSD
jgi:DNA-directed RNA polymerase specialized sigma24 family protein